MAFARRLAAVGRTLTRRVPLRVAGGAAGRAGPRFMSSTPVAKAKMQKAKSSLNMRVTPPAAVLAVANQLCEMAAQGDMAAVRKLVESGADVNAVDYDFRSCLHIAAANGHADLCEWLCANGALQQLDRWGGLPVHDAMRQDHYAVVELLQAQPETSVMLPSQGVRGRTPEIEAQMDSVFKLIVKEGVFSFAIISHEVDYFYNTLGLDAVYFDLHTPAQIAKHIHSFIAAKKVALIGRKSQDICLTLRTGNAMTIICTDENKTQAQDKIDEFMKAGTENEGAHLNYAYSSGPAFEGATQRLAIFNVTRDAFETNPAELSEGEHDLHLTSTPLFQRMKPKDSIAKYQTMLRGAVTSSKAFVSVFPIEEDSYVENTDGYYTHDFKIAYNTGVGPSTQTFLRQLNATITQKMGLDVRKQYVDQFANGISVYSMFVRGSEQEILDMKRYCSLAFAIPDKDLFNQYIAGKISGRELIYFHSACRFAYYFMHQGDENFETLYDELEGKPQSQARLAQLAVGQSLGSEVHKLGSMYPVVERNLDAAKALYLDFSSKMTGVWEGHEYPDSSALVEQVRDPLDKQVLETLSLFNKSILATNLWKDNSSAIAFRLDPSVFMTPFKIPEIPYGVYMIIGLDFTGFHVRFRDISRGGVRLIKSTRESYNHNRTTQFLENYNLAYTQKLKNKDIPESGSKGTILLKQGRNHKDLFAFRQYVDAMMDIMLDDVGDAAPLHRAPGTGKELIFLGPDENTATYMDIAASDARARGFDFWRSFTTGKSPRLGGVPHDTYGMTTRSVRRFVEGVMAKEGLDEAQCTKLMTGGPDGDLGSNEILRSKEKIIGIVDGSGVVCDLDGLDRAELTRLAEERVMVGAFEQKRLGERGFFVGIDDTDVTLPACFEDAGREVANGTDFRNGFHLWSGVEADFFVPCGGRPGSVTISNVDELFRGDGKPRFDYIVEGANLFVTNAARDVLQERGVGVFKDASTNKGGVTSSSLEVLAGLAMSEDSFAKNMSVGADGVVPEFYEQYAADLCDIVERNAENEFGLIWDEMQRTGTHATELTDVISSSMNDLNDKIGASSLFENDAMRRRVLTNHFPKTLVASEGYESICERVPVNYQKAIFSMGVAAEFVYAHGPFADSFKFYEFMTELERES